MAPAKKNDRMGRYRDKMKSDVVKWQKLLEKERKRDKKEEDRKKRLEEDNKLKEEERKKILSRVKKCREKKKKMLLSSVSQVSPIGSYKCKQSFGKAVKRLKNILPESPSKVTAVVRKLSVDVGLNLIKTKPRKQGPRGLQLQQPKVKPRGL